MTTTWNHHSRSLSEHAAACTQLFSQEYHPQPTQQQARPRTAGSTRRTPAKGTPSRGRRSPLSEVYTVIAAAFVTDACVDAQAEASRRSGDEGPVVLNEMDNRERERYSGSPDPPDRATFWLCQVPRLYDSPRFRLRTRRKWRVRRDFQGGHRRQRSPIIAFVPWLTQLLLYLSLTPLTACLSCSQHMCSQTENEPEPQPVQQQRRPAPQRRPQSASSVARFSPKPSMKEQRREVAPKTQSRQ